MLEETKKEETKIEGFFGRQCPKCHNKYCIPFTDRESYHLGVCCANCSTVLWHEIGENSIMIYSFKTPTKISDNEFSYVLKKIYLSLFPLCPVCGEKKWVDFGPRWFKRFDCVYCNEKIRDKHEILIEDACDNNRKYYHFVDDDNPMAENQEFQELLKRAQPHAL